MGPSVPGKGGLSPATTTGDVNLSLAVDWQPLLEALAKQAEKPAVVQLDWKALADRLLTLENAVAEAGEMATEQLGEIAEAVRRIEPTFTFSPQVEPAAVTVLPASELPPSVMVSAVPGINHVEASLVLPAWTRPLLYAGLCVCLGQAVLIAWIAYMVFEAAELTRAFF